MEKETFPTVFPESARWIFLDPERYPDRQRSRISWFAPADDEKWTSALFKKDFTVEHDGEILCALISAECCFRAWIDDVYWCDGPSESGGDYGCSRVLPWAFYDRMQLPELPSGRHTLMIEVCSTNGLQCNYSGGQMGLKAALFRSGEPVLVSDGSWLCSLDSSAVSPLEYRYTEPDDGLRFFPAAVVDDELMNGREYLFSELPELFEYTASPVDIIAPFEPERIRNREAFLSGEAPLVVAAGEPFICYFEFSGEHTAQIGLDMECRCVMNVQITPQEIPGAAPRERDVTEKIFTASRHLRHRSRACSAVKYIKLVLEFGVLDVPEQEDAVINKLQIHIRHYPVRTKSSLETDISEWMTLRDVCCNTLKMCMQKMHLDSPVHQEGLGCVGDYRFMALQSYYLFGEYHLARQDLRRISRMLVFNHGALFHETFALLYIVMLREYVLYSGDMEILTFSEVSRARRLVLDRFKSFKGGSGVLSEVPNFMFVDWVTCGKESLHHPSAGAGMAAMTAFYLMAQHAEEEMCFWTGDSDGAAEARREYEEVSAGFTELFYIPEKHGFINGIYGISGSDPHTFLPPDDRDSEPLMTPHPSILAIAAGVSTGGSELEILDKMVEAAGKHEIQPYFGNYLFEALFAFADSFNRHFDRMIGLYLDLLAAHPDSMRESWTGGDYCHAWSGAPAVWFGKALLGVMPLKPGFAEFLVRPIPGCRRRASGGVPTPSGTITVEWERSGCGSSLFIRCPASLELKTDCRFLPDCRMKIEKF